MNNDSTGSPGGGKDLFQTSMWTMIGLAQNGEETIALEALNSLCSIYWYPIYAYIRRTCGRHEDAEDLAQGYFSDLLARGYLAEARKERGKFRAFLLGDVKLYLANQHRKATSQKRGGGAAVIPIRGEWANERYGHEPVDHVTPDQLFDRQWALTLLSRVMDALRAEYSGAGRLELFDTLKQFISWNAGDESYAVAAARLGKDENYIKVNVHRMRKRYRVLLETEVGHTVASPADIPHEIRQLASSIC